MMTLTKSAVSTLERVLACSDAAGLRILVTDGGCAGLKYQMGLEIAADDDDAVLEFGAAKVFIDPASRGYLDGVTVDFVESTAGGGFQFSNPKAQATCGCGKSFCASR